MVKLPSPLSSLLAFPKGFSAGFLNGFLGLSARPWQALNIPPGETAKAHVLAVANS
jgi:hypothetical protein